MTFAILPDWPAKREPADDVADIQVRAYDRLVTELFDVEKREYRDTFRASAVALGFWFCDNWWRLRCEPLGAPSMATVDWRLRHEMSAGSSNELWPPLMIYGGGARVLLAPALGRPRLEGGLRYVEVEPVSLAGNAYEEGVDRFLERVLGACARHPDAQALAGLFRQVRTERGDEELAGWRRLEACLGFDADQAPIEIVEALTAREADLGEEAIEEAAVAAPGVTAPTTLDAVLDAVHRSDLTIDLSVLASIKGIPDPHGKTPWRAAEQAAAQLRETLGLPDVIGGEGLGDLLRTRWSDLKAATATARTLPYAARAPRRANTSKLALQMVPQIDRRFELARIMGDALWTGGAGLGVISRARTDRQKYQRAFAQSLLCPMRSLRRHVDLSNPTERQIRDAAFHHGVRDKVIITILVNRGFLIPDDGDRLEAA